MSGNTVEMANRIPDGETKVVMKSKATPPTWRILAKDVILVQPEEAKANIAGPVIAFQKDREEHIFVISGPLKDAEKIVISVRETDEGVEKKGKTPFVQKNLLGAISFTGIDYDKAELQKRSNYRAFSVKGRTNICQMHVTFEITTTKLANKKERIFKIEVHVKDQKKVFSHLFKVFDKRKNALLSIKAIGSSQNREEDVEFNEEVEASNDDSPPPRPSTLAAALQEAGSPAYNLDGSFDVDIIPSAKKVVMTGRQLKNVLTPYNAPDTELRAEFAEFKEKTEREAKEAENDRRRAKREQKLLRSMQVELVGTVEEVKSNIDHHTRILKSFKAIQSNVNKELENIENMLVQMRKPKKEAGGASRLSDSDNDDLSVEQSEDDVSSDEEEEDQERKNPDVEPEKKKSL